MTGSTSIACPRRPTRQTPWPVRKAARGRAREDLCTAAAETVGDGLCSQGIGAPRREGDTWVVTAILLVDWHDREREVVD